MTTSSQTGIISVTYNSMTITIQTPTGAACIKNSQSKAGQKAMLEFMKVTQAQGVPFIVLPPNTVAHDMAHITSVDNLEY